MRALDTLTWHVMDAMADDWESVEWIRPHVHEYVGPVSDEEILAILRLPHSRKLVEIMKVPSQPDNVLETQPMACWFGMTEAGRNLWDSEGVKYRDESEV
jgi:hypothetical protein